MVSSYDVMEKNKMVLYPRAHKSPSDAQLVKHINIEGSRGNCVCNAHTYAHVKYLYVLNIFGLTLVEWVLWVLSNLTFH